MKALLKASADGRPDILVEFARQPKWWCCVRTAMALSGVRLDGQLLGAENVARLLLGVAANHRDLPWIRRVNGGVIHVIVS